MLIAIQDGIARRLGSGQWLKSYYMRGDANGDPDGDGLTNAQEYAKRD